MEKTPLVLRAVGLIESAWSRQMWRRSLVCYEVPPWFWAPKVDREAAALHLDELDKHTLAAKQERKVAEAKQKGPAVAVPKAMAKTVTPLFFNTTLPAGLCPALLMPPLAQTTRAPASLPVAQVRVSLQVHPDGVNVRTEVQPQNAGRC